MNGLCKKVYTLKRAMICRREHSDSKGNVWNGLWFVWKHWKSTYHKVSDHRIVYRHSMFGFVFMVVCAKRTFHKKICSDQHDKMPLKFYVLTLLSFISIAVTTRANLHLFCRASNFVKIQTISYIYVTVLIYDIHLNGIGHTNIPGLSGWQVVGFDFWCSPNVIPKLNVLSTTEKYKKIGW